jgi:dihydrofolate reductase
VPGVRKIVVYELLSLDGVAEKPDSFFADWDDAMDANLAAVIATQDAVILGRRSYTEWAQFWPSSQIQPFSFAQALLAADVVDELRLVIAPRIVGRGLRLLDGLPSIQLESIRSKVSPTGYLLVDYRVTR